MEPNKQLDNNKTGQLKTTINFTKNPIKGGTPDNINKLDIPNQLIEYLIRFLFLDNQQLIKKITTLKLYTK